MNEPEGSAPVAGRSEARARIAAHLSASTARIVAAWRAAVAADSRLTTGRSLPRAQLDDHVPHWLGDVARSLAEPPGSPSADAAANRDADQHGLQRWQHGFDLREVAQEWACLHTCLVAEFETFASGAAELELPPDALAEARLRIAGLVSQAMSESVVRYFDLARLEAEGSVRDLDAAMRSLREVEQQRASLWHEAAHDLRGNLGVVSNVAHGLSYSELPPDRRDNFVRLLMRNLDSLHRLLDDVTDLARLQAGHEVRRVEPFDAAVSLRGLCDELRPLAAARRLALRSEGPDTLVVEGDPIKTRRIAQNLLINAIKYTHRGGVVLSWGEAVDRPDDRWTFAVLDTGPGFHSGPGAPLIDAIGEATDAGREESAAPDDAAPEPQSEADDRPVVQESGEGIGLAIVKRLCEVLDATVEVDSVVDEGTVFRIVLPRRYAM